MSDPLDGAGGGYRTPELADGGLQLLAERWDEGATVRGRLRWLGGWRALRRFWSRAMQANITGHAAMVAYSMLLGILPIALLALFIAGQVLSSPALARSVLADLRHVFPGATDRTLTSLLDEVQDSTTSTGVSALAASLWLASSFWGALDTAFGRIYELPSRRWLEQKRFALTMVVVVLLFMVATVAVPTMQSVLRAGVADLPIDLSRVHAIVYALSLAAGVTLLFACLALIYSRVPNWRVPWRAVWPGALGATVAIGAVDYAFPAYLTSISTIARFGTTLVFVLIVLGWFYALALIILGGAIVNALRFDGGGRPAAEEPSAAPPAAEGSGSGQADRGSAQDVVL